MFNQLLRSKRGQNTAEYAILISLVVAGIIAMQTYAQRALQARVRDASSYMTSQTGDGTTAGIQLGTTEQYEPYYLDTDYTITRDSSETRTLDNTVDKFGSTSNRTRAKGGSQKSTYNETDWITDTNAPSGGTGTPPSGGTGTPPPSGTGTGSGS